MTTSVIALVVAVAALVLGAAALVVAIVAARAGRAGRGRRTSGRSQPTLPTDVEGLRREVQALRVEVSDALRHLSVVRYDAFGDMGGHLSWSMALLDDSGNGVVLTSIHGRSEARTYAKNVTGWACDQALSPEEEEAITFARTA
jgi:Protein of unknown function (DUF4446)